jgi:methanogenic corrinoid protein MtbC1
MEQQVDFHRAQAVLGRLNELAERVVDRELTADLKAGAPLDPQSRARCLSDTRFHLTYLAYAAALDAPRLFVDYAGWAKVLFVGLGLSPDHLARHLRIMGEVIAETLGDPAVERCIAAALRALPNQPVESPSYLDGGLARSYLDRLLAGDRHGATRLILDAAKGGMPVADIYMNVFQPSQREVGRLWHLNQLSAAHEHYCTAATQTIMAQLYPYIFDGSPRGQGFIGTCATGEIHELGMRMVTDLFELDGWDTTYLGASSPIAAVVALTAERQAALIGISVTVPSYLGEAAKLIAALRAEPALAGLKILVGGLPFYTLPKLWRELGADAVAWDAREAVRVGHELVGPAP